MIVTIIVVVAVTINRKRRRGSSVSSTTSEDRNSSTLSESFDTAFIISYEKLQFEEQIGSGEFGDVFRYSICLES